MSIVRPHPWHGAPTPRPVVVGVHPGQSPRVVIRATAFAAALHTGVVAVWADISRLAVGQDPDGGVLATPLDPDQADDDETTDVAESLETSIGAEIGAEHVPWRLVCAPGDVTHVLAQVAEAYDTPMIVVGTRRPGFGGWMNEVIGGSVAGHLAHTQSRPVLMVPGAHDHGSPGRGAHDQTSTPSSGSTPPAGPPQEHP